MNSTARFLTSFSKAYSAHCQVRLYARYPSYFVDPVYSKQEVDELLKNKNEIEIKTMSVKAAPSYATCSVFFDPDVHLMSQYLMRKGNRLLAKTLIEQTFEKIKRIQLDKYYSSSSEDRHEIEIDPRKIFHKAVQNTTPVLTTKVVKRSGTTYHIPAVVLPRKAKFLAMKFIIEAANEKDVKDRFYIHLAHELISASENKGKAVQKKVDLHKYCEANRAYAHYRWA